MAWIGRLAVRFRYLVIAAWLVVTIFCVLAFPALGSIVNSDNSSFLPGSAPSKQAAILAEPFQPAGIYTSLMVAVRTAGPLTTDDQAAFTRAESAAGKVAHVSFVRDQGVSSDGQARKALVGIDVSPSDSRAGGVVDGLRAALAGAGAPPDLDLHLTGTVASNVDNSRAASDANKRTQIFTNVVILLMLLLVFRAALAPIVTLFPAVLVPILAGPVIARASSLGFQVSSFTQVILTVLVLGAGTDYGLFLILRMREEIRRGHTASEAVIEAVDKVGESITFSAGTVIGALLCLLL
ncbi:MAG: MMPL family transporter, partial [Chloroflexota bacterium]